MKEIKTFTKKEKEIINGKNKNITIITVITVIGSALIYEGISQVKKVLTSKN